MHTLRTLALLVPLAAAPHHPLVPGSGSPLVAPTEPASGAAPSGSARAAGVPVGPPWISIEYPVNPYDATTRAAFLVVHAFHHGTPTGFPVSGTAEGIVDGERRSIPLRFTPTSRTGAYALTRQWPSDGTWTLVVSVAQGPEDTVSAVVELGRTGEVAAVRVPTRRRDGWTIPAPVVMAEVEAALRQRAAQLSSR
ncbi:MAG TPA: hypothetical protein VFV33_10200 [Gemmatimonadaceae bacterium]|nr:hypothetical protein [Gemmatimonadaceae bacterium]